MARSSGVQAFRLRYAEKEFLDEILNKAALHVKMQDRKKCHAYARNLILADNKILKLTTAKLRPIVLARINEITRKTCKLLSSAEGVAW
jgi:hypothetical protein